MPSLLLDSPISVCTQLFFHTQLFVNAIRMKREVRAGPRYDSFNTADIFSGTRKTMIQMIVVALGGAVGSAFRYIIGRAMVGAASSFPWG
ncbi:CrcB family protein, partial [Candidatus Bipolaricaulota bacterium]|nr:CrcB family protein [Candidatus Bipolaricaulota bacterium]